MITNPRLTGKTSKSNSVKGSLMRSRDSQGTRKKTQRMLGLRFRITERT